MDVVYHTHYLVWFEIGRTELMRELGCDYASMEDRHGIYFPLREVGARYHAPARYDDLLDVHTVLSSVGGASVRFDYRVLRRRESRLLVTGFTQHAAVGGEGRPRRLPPELRRRLSAGMGRR
jgi:acyl-CoA thioester hydrolase